MPRSARLDNMRLTAAKGVEGAVCVCPLCRDGCEVLVRGPIRLWDALETAWLRPTQWAGDALISPDPTHLADAQGPARVLRPEDRARGPGRGAHLPRRL